MSFLDKLLGTDEKLIDKDIVQDMIKDSKFCSTSLSTATAEAVNPELRTMLKQKLDNAVKEHFELSDMVINKGWYPANDQPIQQLEKDYEDSKDLT